jgi:aldehyde:ferredoxin oxidoreductase
MWILRLDMTDRTSRLEEAPERYGALGGRGLSSTMVYDEVPPSCHPLGPNNKLIFAPGIVTGTAAATSARISVGPNLPLTRAIRLSRTHDRPSGKGLQHLPGA